MQPIGLKFAQLLIKMKNNNKKSVEKTTQKRKNLEKFSWLLALCFGLTACTESVQFVTGMDGATPLIQDPMEDPSTSPPTDDPTNPPPSNGDDVIPSFINGDVYAIQILSDDSVLIGGDFTKIGNVNAKRFAKFTSTGDLVAACDLTSGFDKAVHEIVVDATGKIYVGGDFDYFGATQVGKVARLNSDCTLDTTFNVGIGFDHVVRTMAIQHDGRVLVGGYFSNYNGLSAPRITRLKSSGVKDASFVSLASPSDAGSVQAITMMDGQILIGHSLWSYGPSSAQLNRLNSDGTLDTSFFNGSAPDAGATGWYNVPLDILVESNTEVGTGKITSAGGTSMFIDSNGTTTYYDGIARLNGDGRPDSSFLPFQDSVIGAIWKIKKNGFGYHTAGFHRELYTTQVNYFARLSDNGSIDTACLANTGTGFNKNTWSVGLQSNGRIVLGGAFTVFNGGLSGRLIMLNSDCTVYRRY